MTYRLLLKELSKVFFLVLFSIISLFILIDYSFNIQQFSKSHMVVFYYAFQILTQLHLLLPLALLISTLKVLISYNIHYELIALQAGGISLKRLSLPFFTLALACYALLTVNMEFSLPVAKRFTENFASSLAKRKKQTAKMGVLTLKDDSKLIYECKEGKEYQDVYWIRHFDDVWHMKSLEETDSGLIGHFVDHIKGGESYKKVASFDKRLMREISLPEGSISFESFENRSLSSLFKDRKLSKEHKPEIESAIAYKLLIPLLSFTVVLAGFLFCTSYARSFRPFMVYSIALFGFICFFTIMDACVILGENRTLPPFVVIGFLPLLLNSILIRKYIKL